VEGGDARTLRKQLRAWLNTINRFDDRLGTMTCEEVE
jgi:hypothetical protein